MHDVPCELVDKILKHAMGSQSDFTANTFCRAAAVRVCRRWRDLVYENSYFWRTVTLYRFMTRKHITFVLHKAQQAPEFRLVVNTCEHESMTDGHRTTLVVCQPLSDFDALLSELLAELFDEVGQLRVEASNCGEWARVMALFMRLPSKALHRVEAYTRGLGQSQRHIPREGAVWSSVTTMNLDAVNPMWLGAPVFSGLTELAMGRVWGSFCVQTSTLLAVLDNARQLTVLKLQDVESTPHRDQIAGTVITLPHLTHFCFIYSRNSCTLLLRHLHLPHVRHLRLHAVNKARLHTFLDVSKKWSLVPHSSSTSSFLRCVDIINEVASRDFGHEGPRAIPVMESNLVGQRDVLVNIHLHLRNEDTCRPHEFGMLGSQCSLEYTVEVEHKAHRYTRKSTGEGYIVERNVEAANCVWDNYPTRAIPARWLE
ncbi:hypothetical protein C8R47DRAFT_1072907 [Mycena vitilis]|nr:hypothetical protein C8R47DRAFT_1072907 [Mycena vitilis]